MYELHINSQPGFKKKFNYSYIRMTKKGGISDVKALWSPIKFVIERALMI